jgi:hypothetical protein
MFVTIFAVLSLIPGGLLGSSLIADYSLLKLLVLAGLAAVSTISAAGILYNIAVKPKT